MSIKLQILNELDMNQIVNLNKIIENEIKEFIYLKNNLDHYKRQRLETFINFISEKMLQQITTTKYEIIQIIYILENKKAYLKTILNNNNLDKNNMLFIKSSIDNILQVNNIKKNEIIQLLNNNIIETFHCYNV